MAEKNNIVDLNRERVLRFLKKLLRALRIPLAVVLAVAVLIVGVSLLGEVTTSHITDSLRDVRLLFSKGPGYPYTLEAYSTRSVALIGRDPFILTRDGVTVLDPSADSVQQTRLQTADSHAVLRNGRALVYNNASGALALLSRSRLLAKADGMTGVVTAALADNGVYATVTMGDGAAASVQVFDRRQNPVFRWNCAKERISAVALSPNGKQVAVLAVGAQNAELYTRLLTFRTDRDAPLLDQTYEGVCLLRLFYTARGRLIAVGDAQTLVLDRKGGVLETLHYTADSLNFVCGDDDGNVLLCYDALGGAKVTVVRIGANGRQTCQLTAEYVPAGFAIDGGSFALADGDRITCYNAKGVEKRTVTARGEVSQLLLHGRRIYTVENGALNQY